MIDPATVPPIRPANVLAAPPPDLDSPFNGTSAVVGRNTPRFPTRRARGRPGARSQDTRAKVPRTGSAIAGRVNSSGAIGLPLSQP